MLRKPGQVDKSWYDEYTSADAEQTGGYSGNKSDNQQ
jgi:hypothetical protein